MKFEMLRLIMGNHAIKGGDVVTANDATAIEMIGGGHFLIKRAGQKAVFIPNHQVHFGICEELPLATPKK